MYPSSLPNIDLQVLPTFPANVVATGAVDISKSGLTYTFGLNFQNVIEETNVSDMSKREVLAQDTDTGAFWRIKLSNLPTGQADWSNIQNKPATFPPSPHTHTVAEISDATPLGQSLVTAANTAAALATLGAQANLGYTPANKAGDTFTGNVDINGTLSVEDYISARATDPLDPSGPLPVTYFRVRGGAAGQEKWHFFYHPYVAAFSDNLTWDYAPNGVWERTCLRLAPNGNLFVTGALSAASKSFLIDHPVDPFHRNLRHISVEAPEYQIRYRGVATLEAGQATVDIDAACGMTAGTFAALAADAWVQSLQPQDSFERVKCSDVVGGVFTLTSEDAGSSARVAWEVTARRKDPFVLHSDDSDEDGRLIVEFDKPDAPNADD